ncbi:MAG: hypothetical protein ACI9QV_000315 [Methylophagaceae bacterium]|jgi:hypothetical protein
MKLPYFSLKGTETSSTFNVVKPMLAPIGFLAITLALRYWMVSMAAYRMRPIKLNNLDVTKV